MKKIGKYIEYITTKISLMVKQRVFSFENTRVKYIFEQCEDSSDIIVVLSSCTRQGVKARYNYMRTLHNVRANKLFILDDFGPDGRGSYYIGRDYTFCEDLATKALIEMFIEKTAAKRVIFTGSSKGGWAAMNFGLQFNNSYIVCGAPQYYVANWFGKCESLKYITGDFSEERIHYVNNYLRQRIFANESTHSQRISLHYSDKDHTYCEHIQYMVADLEKAGYTIERDIEHYENHSDVSIYFPKYMVSTINAIIEN